MLIAASVQPVLSGTVVEDESNHEILDAIDHAHQQLIAAEIAELVGILRAADRWKIDQDAVGAGIERLIQPGHDGTPRIAEFLALEIGALLGISQTSALCRIGDALDLRHRHPKLWQAVLTGKVRVWQATKICLECAHLSRSAAHNVDAAMAASIGMLPWTRIMKALPGQIIAADPDTARQREQARRESRRIRISPIEDGHVSIHGVVNPVDGIKFDHVLNEVAKTFPTEPDTPLCRDLDRRRSLAFGMITQDAYTKLHREKPLLDLSETPSNRLPQRSTPTTHEPIGCTLIVHIAADDPALDLSPTSTTGVARIEGWGPLLTEQLPHFLNGANITVRPIIDPTTIRPVDSYETPTRMRLALEQRNPVDVFPYGTTQASRCDSDHTIPYIDGRSSQTHLGNLGPLSRKAHRAKTHGKWKLEQPTPGTFHWTSPHGYQYQVTPTGTIRIRVPEQARGF